MDGGGRVEAGTSSWFCRDEVSVAGSDYVSAEEKDVGIGCRDEVSVAGSDYVSAAEKDVGIGDEAVEGDDAEDDDGVEGDVGVSGFVPGPLIPLKEHLERDKDDESLRRWKEKLLGCFEGELNGQMEPEVTFHSIGIVSEGCAEIITPLPINENQSRALFTLKEGSQYRLKLTFSVQHNIVSGLTYLNTVWKGGFQVDQVKGMLGTFAPQREPYVQMLDEETTPSGALARGIYSAKLKFEDDDKRCHMGLSYTFEIKSR